MTDNTVKGFSFWTGWFLVVACMVGSGILTTSGIIVQNTGSYWLLLDLWALGGVIALCGALTLAELASGIPRVGGDYTFVREAFGPAVGFAYGWATLLLGFAAPIALISYTTTLYLQPFIVPLFQNTSFLEFVSSKLFLYVSSSLLIVLFTFLHCRGHKESGRVQGATTLFKLAILFVLIAMAFFSPETHWSNLSSGPSETKATFSSCASSLILIMYAYTGWNAAAYIGGEIRNSSRTVPLCLGIGCLSVVGFYLIINIVYGITLPVDAIFKMTSDEASRICERAAEVLLGSETSRVFSLLISLGVIATLSAYILTGPRVVFAMAQDRLLPEWFGHISERTNVPVRATLLQGLFALLFLWSNSFQNLLDFTGYGLGVLAMLVVAPIFVLRKRADFQPTFRVPFYPWTPLLFLVLSTTMLIGGAAETPRLALFSVLSICLGFPFYFVWRWIRFRAGT